MTDADRRTALETERKQLLLRLSDWSARIDRMDRPSAGDYVMPLSAGCGVAAMLFAALVFYVVQRGPDDARSSTDVVMLVLVILAIVAGVVFIIRRQMRNTRTAETKRTRDMAVGLLQVRLREIEEALRDLGPQ